MLSQADNELLCRVGPGTLMGDFMRQFWVPAARSDELPAPDCPPLRVRLLGENLIAFRLTSGRVGLIANHCPHRGASLFFGRNEEEGLRCVYHGWKFAHDGRCVDMPNEPPESNFKDKIRAVAYPCQERNGIIWAYMGPRETPPPLPDLEANMHAKPYISVIHRSCNWMQGWEGEMDTVHVAFLHMGHVKREATQPGSFDYFTASNRAAQFHVIDTPYGTAYGVNRPAGDDGYYWRVAHQLFPFYAMIPTGALGHEVRFAAYVPMDDENTLHFELWADVPWEGEVPTEAMSRPPMRDKSWYRPNTSDWYGRFNFVQSAENDYNVDRGAQKRGESFTGIPGIRQQDIAVTDSMGPIMDRTSEHLGTTDVLIIRTRRRLLAAAKALREQGETPPPVDRPDLYRQRSGGVVLPRGVDWWEGTADLRERFQATV
jgi:phenylpropionate dioxygenase-like ring-hydroxylating dioxygenase large terminal subunit